MPTAQELGLPPNWREQIDSALEKVKAAKIAADYAKRAGIALPPAAQNLDAIETQLRAIKSTYEHVG